MIVWIYLLGILTVLSYLSDVAILSLPGVKIPFCNLSIISILILLCLVGMLGRLLQMTRRGEKENLRKRIGELEKELKTLHEKNK